MIKESWDERISILLCEKLFGYAVLTLVLFVCFALSSFTSKEIQVVLFAACGSISIGSLQLGKFYEIKIIFMNSSLR